MEQGPDLREKSWPWAMEGVLVLSGCRGNAPWQGSSSTTPFWKLAVWAQGPGGQVLARASSGVQTAHCCIFTWWKKETNSPTWSRKGTAPFTKAPPSGPNSLPRAHLQSHHRGREPHMQSLTQGHNWWEICLMRNVLIICVQQTTPKLG